MPSKEKVEHAKINNSKNIGHCKYVDYIRVECKEKYNDIYKYLIDNNYVPEGYKSNEKKDNKKLSKKRNMFRNKCKKNYFIDENRLYYRYKRNNIVTNCKIPYVEEIFPLLSNTHIENDNCGYKMLCNLILLKKYYWEGYTKKITQFLSKCEICAAEKKTKIIKPETKIILDEGPKFRYVCDTWTLPQDLSINTDYVYGLDIIDHFSKYYNCFLLKNKTMKLCISKIKLFMINNGFCKLLQTDNDKEFDNPELKVFCENNNIKYVKSSPIIPKLMAP